MTDLTKVFIDLSKCTEEHQINKIYSIIKNDNIDSFTRSRLRSGHTFKSYFLINEGDWVLTQVDYKLSMRTELTYPDFIKLFEGGDVENQTYTKEDIEKLKADKAELLEALETVIHNSDVPNEIYDQSKSLIQKMKQ